MSKILLLEDDVSLVDGLKYSLGKNGFDVTVVRTVEKALESLSIISEYDLLLLDVTLPDGTGFDVCEKVRRQNRQIPIIFLTASDEEVSILVLIALITIFNVMNSIAMSVAARMKQYGAFCAIGLTNRQLTRMIVAEAAAYAVTGSICGGIFGVLCNKLLFDKLVGFMEYSCSGICCYYSGSNNCSGSRNQGAGSENP